MAQHLSHATEVPVIWKPCPTCWGQRRIGVKDDEGIYRAHTCDTCLGLGEIQSNPPTQGKE